LAVKLNINPNRSDPCFTVSPLELYKQAPLKIKGAFRLSAKKTSLQRRVFYIRQALSALCVV
jgi:hypothetical protein